MLIGINAVAAFKRPRTGVEEYTYQLIKHLTMLETAGQHRFILYVNNANVIVGSSARRDKAMPWKLPDNFLIKKLSWPLPMWTQIRLALEMLWHKPDALFIPVHVLPRLCPENSIVTVHGLEYEYYPEMYPKTHIRYIRWATKDALRRARKIIAVSENTKKDLIKLYGGQPEKIEVVHHGIEITKRQLSIMSKSRANRDWQRKNLYLLFIGRLETKKNIQGLIDAFKLLKLKYQAPHKLILVGIKGYGYDRLSFGRDIIQKGYVSEREKWTLLKNADAFILPSFYEGFGMPILEAQAAGCPVIASNVSSMPEVAGKGAILIGPRNIEEICEALYKIISDNRFREDLIKKGYENIKRFSWQKCAKATLKVLTEL